MVITDSMLHMETINKELRPRVEHCQQLHSIAMTFKTTNKHYPMVVVMDVIEVEVRVVVVVG